MRKDFWNLLLWVSGFTVLFIVVLGVTIYFTNAKVIDSASVIYAIGILVAICVGGVFGYQRLQIFRTFEPHLNIAHNVSHRQIGDGYVHIDVTATLHNRSKVQVELREGFFRLQLVAPVSDEQIERLYAQVFADKTEQHIQWDTLEQIQREWRTGELIVEPGESHPETYEFIVSKNVESVIIYTYFYNPRFSQNTHSAEGWVATTVYDIVTIDRDSASE